MLPSKYEDNTLQIKERSTERTAPFFCTGSYRPFCRRYLGIHPDSAALFYRKIRTVTNHRLALAADEVFERPAGPGGSCFGVRRKGRRGRGAAGKAVVFGIPKRNGRAYTVAADNAEPETLPLPSKRKSCRTVLFMPIARAAAASWTRAVLPVAASTVPRNLQTVGTTLTALGTLESGKTRLAKIQRNRS
ncbi:IS1016 group transposase [Neisseria gonorrhoeae]|uniref:IS1016 group transposase n=1 Tax=Neisseria gonorrhoeae TaxID=485 RepID=A0A378VWM7_NEIGO|nr:IS1016 group transposase [Neisseria gonorrhoeae]